MRLAYRWEWCKGETSPSSVFGGQKTGDYWAAILDGPNQWVQVGQWYDGANTAYAGCKTHWEIAKYDPLWGNDKNVNGPAHGGDENNFILCSKAVEFTKDDLYGAKMDLNVVLEYGWEYSAWGCNVETPCRASLDAELRLWIGIPVAGGGHGPNGMYAGYKVWHTNSAMDTYELLMGKVESAASWDPAYQGTGDQRNLQMHSTDSIERKKMVEYSDSNAYFFTRITNPRYTNPNPQSKPSPTSYGDPHFITWGGDAFDFHGGCDLVLLENPGFANGLGMNVHIRTNIKTWWSHIKSAAVQIGDHTLEITAGTGSAGNYWINGGNKMELQTGDAFIGDFPIHFKRINDHQSATRINLGNGDAISVETFKDFVRVNFKDKSETAFKGSAGLLGSYEHGSKVGRNGTAVFVSPNEFGQEWMVRPTDTILFHDTDAAQLPLVCPMPDTTEKKEARRLGEGSISEEDAALACARVNAGIHRDACIFDVMATQDKDMAGSF